MDGLALVLVGFLLGVPTGMVILACFMAARSRRAPGAGPRAGRAHQKRE